MNILFYLGLGMQLFGLIAVGMCFITGIQIGDYGKVELAQFVLGGFVFYSGTYLKSKQLS